MFLIFILLGAACLFWFGAVQCYINLSLGTVCGLLLGALLLACALAVKKGSRQLRRVLFSLLGLVVLDLCVQGAILFRSTQRTPPADEPCTVLVLGCRVKGEEPSLMLAQRIRAAAGYLERNPQAVCICTGGQGSDEAISEAECICRTLTAAGIDPARLYLEDRSTSTEENLDYSAELICREGLPDTVAVATSDYHEYRACRLADDRGLKACALPAATSWYMMPTFFLRECVAVWRLWLFSR